MSLDFTDDQSKLVQVMACVVRQQAITWGNVDPDLCHHMASLGHNEFNATMYFSLLKTSSMQKRLKQGPADWDLYQ